MVANKLVNCRGVLSCLFGSDGKIRRPSKYGEEILFDMPFFVQKFITGGMLWWDVVGDFERQGRLMYPSSHFVGLYDNLVLLNGYDKRFSCGEFSYFRYVAIFYFFLTNVDIYGHLCGRVDELRCWVDSLDFSLLWSLDRYLRYIMQADEVLNVFELKCLDVHDFARFYFPKENVGFAILSIRLAMLYVFGYVRFSALSERFLDYDLVGTYETIEFNIEEYIGVTVLVGEFNESSEFRELNNDPFHEDDFYGPSLARRYDNVHTNWSRFRDWDMGFRYLYEFRDELYVRYRKVLSDFVFAYTEAFLGGWFGFIRLLEKELLPTSGDPSNVANWDISDLSFLFLLKEYVDELKMLYLEKLDSDIWDVFVEPDFGTDFVEVDVLEMRYVWLSVLGFAGFVHSELNSTVSELSFYFNKMLTGGVCVKFDHVFLEELFLCSVMLSGSELEHLFNELDIKLVEGPSFKSGTQERDYLFYDDEIFEKLFSENSSLINNIPVSKASFMKHKQNLLREEFVMLYGQTWWGAALVDENSFFHKVFRKFAKNLLGDYSWSVVDLVIKLDSYKDSIFVQFTDVCEWIIGQGFMSTGDTTPYENQEGRQRSQYGATGAFEEESFDELYTYGDFGFGEMIDGESAEVKEERRLYKDLTVEEKNEFLGFLEYIEFSGGLRSEDRSKVDFYSEFVYSFYNDLNHEEETFTHTFVHSKLGLFGEDKLWGFSWFFPDRYAFVLYDRALALPDFSVWGGVVKFCKFFRRKILEIVNEEFVLDSSSTLFYSGWKYRLLGVSRFYVFSSLFESRILFFMLLFPFLFFKEWRLVFGSWVELPLHKRSDIFYWFFVSLCFIFMFFLQFCILMFLLGVWFLWNYTNGVFKKVVLYPLFYLFGLVLSCFESVQFIGHNGLSFGYKFDWKELYWIFYVVVFYCFLKFVFFYHAYEMGIFLHRFAYSYSLNGFSFLLLSSFFVSIIVFVFIGFFWKTWRRVWSGLFGFFSALAFVYNSYNFYESESVWFSPYNQWQAWRFGRYFGETKPVIMLPQVVQYPWDLKDWLDKTAEYRVRRRLLAQIHGEDKLAPRPEWMKVPFPREWGYRRGSDLRKLQEAVHWGWYKRKPLGYAAADMAARTKETTFYGDYYMHVRENLPFRANDLLFRSLFFSLGVARMYIPWELPARNRARKKPIYMPWHNNSRLLFMFDRNAKYSIVGTDNTDWEKLTFRQLYRGAFHLDKEFQWDIVENTYTGLPGRSVTRSADPLRERSIGGVNLHHLTHAAFFRGLIYEYPYFALDVGLQSSLFRDDKFSFIKFGYRSIIINLQDLKVSISLVPRNQRIFDHYVYCVPARDMEEEFSYQNGPWRFPYFTRFRLTPLYIPMLDYEWNFAHCNHVYMCLIF